jgi:YHS domain-containing protein
MKVICNLCGKISDLMASTSFAIDEERGMKTYHFCCDEHLTEFGRRRGIALDKH